MGWKQWPYWVKGGILAVIISFVGGIILASIQQFTDVNLLDTSSYIAFVLIFPFLIGLASFLLISLTIESGGQGWEEGSPLIAFGIIIIGTLVVFLVGAVIGLIVGKIKSKKQPLQQLNNNPPDKF